MRLLSLSLPSPALFSLLVLGLLSYASPALAAWGEAWGAMVWGLPVAVPTLTGVGLIVLALAFSASAAWTLRKRRGALGLPVLLVLLAVPLVVAAGTVTVPNTFVNGTPADANQVNANFEAVETAVNDNDSRIMTLQGVVATAQSTADAASAGHTVDTNTQLTPAEVAAAATAQGFVAGAHTTETQVDAFVADNGYGLAVDVSANTAAIAALGAATGLEACADGLTVADHDTGLLWERKTGTFDPAFPASGLCKSAGCPDAHDVNNRYQWCHGETPNLDCTRPNGLVFRLFLANLNNSNVDANGNVTGNGSLPSLWNSEILDEIGIQTSGCFADHCDWRLPNLVEIRTILDCDLTQSPITCIDPLFGPTATSVYWTATCPGQCNIEPPSVSGTLRVWGAKFYYTGFPINADVFDKTLEYFVRAVRAGSCGP